MSKVGPKLRGIGAGRVTQVFMCFSVALLLAGIVSNGIQISIALKAMDGSYNRAEIEASDTRLNDIGALEYVLIAVTGIAFATWFYRSHKNLDELGGYDTTYHSAWAVAGFFFPFLNFVRPAQIFREIWYGSDPKVLESYTSRISESQSKPPEMPRRIALWWALFITSIVVTNVAARVSHNSEQPLKSVVVLSAIFILSDIMLICSGILAILLIDQVLRWQPLRLELVRSRLENEKGTESDTTES